MKAYRQVAYFKIILRNSQKKKNTLLIWDISMIKHTIALLPAHHLAVSHWTADTTKWKPCMKMGWKKYNNWKRHKQVTVSVEELGKKSMHKSHIPFQSPFSQTTVQQAHSPHTHPGMSLIGEKIKIKKCFEHIESWFTAPLIKKRV